MERASLDEIRSFHAKLMADASRSYSRSHDQRLERIFELVPREAFFPPGPWMIQLGGSTNYLETPSADPTYLYQNTLVALDADKQINNGTPFLHAAWIGAVAPQPGEDIAHIGAGTGYYTAILSMLVRKGGCVTAFEIEEKLAAAARQNLLPFDNVTVVAGNAVSLAIPPSDLIYVNAGVVAPPLQWLRALRLGGRLIFPWRPSEAVGLAVFVTRTARGFELRPLMSARFIACIGASEAVGLKLIDARAAWQSRSIRLSTEHQPDETATAVYPDVWFSSDALSD